MNANTEFENKNERHYMQYKIIISKLIANLTRFDKNCARLPISKAPVPLAAPILGLLEKPLTIL